MRHSQRTWFRFGSKSPSRRRSARLTPLQVELLEARTVLSVTLPTPGSPGPIDVTGTSGPDAFLIRLLPGSTGDVQVSDDGGTTFHTAALADVTEIRVNGLQGKDELTLDEGNGLIAGDGGPVIQFDGGPGHDTLVLTGDPGLPTTELYGVGTTSDAGVLTTSGGTETQTVQFLGVSAIISTTTAAQFTLNLNDEGNLLRVEKGKTVGALGTLRLEGVDRQGERGALDALVDDRFSEDRREPSRETFVPITLANKSGVVLNTLGGDDLILLDASPVVTGLTTLTIDGGAGTDRLLGNETPTGATVSIIDVERSVPDASQELFIEDLYVSRLHRSAGDDELALWKSVLQGNPAGQTTVAQWIERSPEARGRLVSDWFEHYLGREAGPDETRVIADLMVLGLTEEQVLAAILASPEYYSRAGSLSAGTTADDRFVRTFYSSLLGRSASEQEVRDLVAVLPVVGRGVVATVFLHSDEFRGRVVEGVYDGLLQREADDNGRDFWVRSGLDLTTIRQVFESTSEFFDDRRGTATVVDFDTAGVLHLEGTSSGAHDRQYFQFVAPVSGLLRVSLRSTSGVARLDIEDGQGRKLLETEPNDGIDTAQAMVTAGSTYFLRVRSQDDTPAGFAIDLQLSVGAPTPPGDGPPPGGAPGLPSILTETEDNGDRSRANAFALSAGGTAQLKGTSNSRDDRDFFTFTAPSAGTLRVRVQTTAGVAPKLEIENSQGLTVFETEPNDGIQSGPFVVSVGASYYLRLRSTEDTPSSYLVELSLT